MNNEHRISIEYPESIYALCSCGAHSPMVSPTHRAELEAWERDHLGAPESRPLHATPLERLEAAETHLNRLGTYPETSSAGETRATAELVRTRALVVIAVALDHLAALGAPPKVDHVFAGLETHGKQDAETGRP